MTKQFTPDLKLKAVNYYDKIKNYVKVCEIFECSERSLKRWVERNPMIVRHNNASYVGGGKGGTKVPPNLGPPYLPTIPP